MTPAVSAVIPSIGRPSLKSAVASVLAQSLAVAEVIIVLDTEAPVRVPTDDRIVVLRATAGSGAARCRQIGIDAACGSLIALLDDDDEWLPDKLKRQLAEVGHHTPSSWIASSRTAVIGPGDRRRIWPRRLIATGEPIAEYLFRVDEIGVGATLLQTSTLVFPTELARRVRWDAHAGAVHDEPSWLLEVQRAVPDVHLLQVPEALSVYNVTAESVSRSSAERTDEYIAWGRTYLSAESARVRGDYQCASPVSAAVAASSVSGVARAVAAALRHGRPGPFALVYAASSMIRIVAVRLLRIVR